MREKLQKIQANLKIVMQQVNELQEILDAQHQDRPQLTIPNIVTQSADQPSNVKNGVIQLGMPPAGVMERVHTSDETDAEEEVDVDDLDEEFNSYGEDSDDDEDSEDDAEESGDTIEDVLAQLGNDRTRTIGKRIVKHLSDGKECTQQELSDFLSDEVESKVKAVARDMADKRLLVTVSHKPKTYKLPKSLNPHS